MLGDVYSVDADDRLGEKKKLRKSGLVCCCRRFLLFHCDSLVDLQRVLRSFDCSWPKVMVPLVEFLPGRTVVTLVKVSISCWGSLGVL